MNYASKTQKNGRLKIFGVVVLFHPDIDTLCRNIETYLDYVTHLYLVCNSPISDPSVISQRIRGGEKIDVIQNSANYGVARALNTAAQLALQEKCQWLLTMDQDSHFCSDNLLKEFNKLPGKDNVVIFSPTHIEKEAHLTSDTPCNTTPIAVMTSGNLLNLNIWNKIGGFDESLFIDEVDTEFCLRALKSGYQIVQSNVVYLKHPLGKRVHRKIGRFEFSYNVHSSNRYFYIFRNGLMVARKYEAEFPQFVRKRRIQLLKELIKIALEKDNRLRNFRMAALGTLKYLKNDLSELD